VALADAVIDGFLARDYVAGVIPSRRVLRQNAGGAGAQHNPLASDGTRLSGSDAQGFPACVVGSLYSRQIRNEPIMVIAKVGPGTHSKERIVMPPSKKGETPLTKNPMRQPGPG